MANPLIDLLSGSAKSAYGFLEEAARTPASANQILRDLSAAGLTIRRQTGLDIIATLRGALDAARVARLAPTSAIIPAALLPPSPHPLQNNYSFRVAVNNAPVGFPQFINVPSAVPLSLDQIFSAATSFLTAGDSPQIRGTMAEAPDLTFDRGLRTSDDFTSQQISDYAGSQQTPEFLDLINQGPIETGPEGFGHGF